MRSRVTTYGGEVRDGCRRTVQHWQLHVNDEFIGDTSIPQQGDLFQRIADAINRADALDDPRSNG